MPGVVNTRSTSADASLLLDYLTEPLKNLEPQTHYASFGKRRDVPEGFNVLNFPQVTKFATSEIGTIVEGVDPTIGDISTTAYRSAPTQLGDIKVMSDLLLRNIAIDLLNEAIKNNQDAVKRSLDDFIQTVVNSNTDVIYAGGKLSRATLGAGDKITMPLHLRAIAHLRKADSAGVKPIGGAYVAIADPDTLSDLMADVGAAGWSDTARYTDPEAIRSATVGMWRGARFLESANQHTFSSSVTVHAVTYLGEDSFGWGYYQTPMPVLITTPDSANPLALRTTIGVKFSLAAVLFESFRMTRIECAATNN